MIEELSYSDLADIGIDVRGDEFSTAYRKGDTIVVVCYDPDLTSMLDCPRDDNSGEDAWEWIEWDSGRQRNEWTAAHFDCAHCCEPPYAGDACPAWDEPHACAPFEPFRPGLDFWIERYEHGLVRYAPSGESSMIDRQWDVAPGVAIMRFKEDHGCGDSSSPDGLLDFVRAVCDEYTSWCNGECFGIITYERQEYTPGPYLPRRERWLETESVWGLLGWRYAESEAKAQLGVAA